MELKKKDLITSAIFLALAIIFTLGIHFTKFNGAIFSPMHLPVLLCGFILGPGYGFIIGILSPIINSLLKVIPTFPVAWSIVVEVGLYGLMSGLLYKKSGMKIIPALIGSMIIGKLGGALILSKALGKSIKIITFLAIPGIIIQLVLVPLIIKIYEKKTRTIIALE
ncbi:MAG TPA: ECF transporter S component [Tissierellales bacterium]|nr:ECF transporter S component [Tissierellales bacterium]